MESIKPRTKLSIKWKNIMGLVVLVLVVFAVITAMSFISGWMKGNCVEKGYIKACFSIDKPTLAKHEAATITVDVTNIGETRANATILLKLSPSLQNMSAASQQLGPMNPDDTIKKEFRVASKDELGKFKIEVDLNQDGASDKDLFLTVEQK